jgi:hypothetical protein
MKIVPLLLLSQILAMNWEGHDDWMTELPAGLALEQAVKDAVPLPPKPCAMREQFHDNPYEQIPLRCPEKAPSPAR